MSQDYYYLATVDPSFAVGWRAATGNKYAKELTELFGDYATHPLSRFAMTKEQLALFFYLRCRMGGHNGVKDLDMQRVRSDRHPAADVADIRSSSAACGADEAPEPTVVALAQELEQVDALLARVGRGETLSILGLDLNGDHMTQVLKAQRAHVRAKLVAKINIPTN